MTTIIPFSNKGWTARGCNKSERERKKVWHRTNDRCDDVYMDGFKQTFHCECLWLIYNSPKNVRSFLLHFVACCARIKLNVNDGNRLCTLLSFYHEFMRFFFFAVRVQVCVRDCFWPPGFNLIYCKCYGCFLSFYPSFFASVRKELWSTWKFSTTSNIRTHARTHTQVQANKTNKIERGINVRMH